MSAVPRKTYKFLPDPNYVREDMLFDEQDTLNALHSWLPLSSGMYIHSRYAFPSTIHLLPTNILSSPTSEARGYVQIPNHASYPTLSTPYIVPLDRMSDGPAYMMAVFHQLHCLSYVVDHYQQGYAGANLTGEVAHHSAHCFDYLRQSIMCAADTNLEGDTETGPGWGSEHTCADYDAVLAWANERGAMRWRTGLLPGVAIL